MFFTKLLFEILYGLSCVLYFFSYGMVSVSLPFLGVARSLIDYTEERSLSYRGILDDRVVSITNNIRFLSKEVEHLAQEEEKPPKNKQLTLMMLRARIASLEEDLRYFKKKRGNFWGEK